MSSFQKLFKFKCPVKTKIRNKLIHTLDSYLFPQSCRIKVLILCNLEEIQDQYFVRAKSFRKLYYYWQKVGFLNTARKIISRGREQHRNEKFISVGVGEIIDFLSDKYQSGQVVFFIATNHPACAERVVIHEDFIVASHKDDWPIGVFPEQLIYFKNLKPVSEHSWWSAYRGWSALSGQKNPVTDPALLRDKIINFFKKLELSSGEKMDWGASSSVQEIQETQEKKIVLKSQKTAVLFGLGNYAKTRILPSLDKRLRVTKIHDLDPLQLVPMKPGISYDTSPTPRPDENYDVYWIAGYHHMHTPLAIEGLKKGLDVVVEKPLVTNWKDLENLLAVMSEPLVGRLYVSYQKRYHLFNQFIKQDCELKPGDPLSYYAIVHEEPLPDLHWYRWPNSRSAIVSNGCHWIDHFMFLNHYSAVNFKEARRISPEEITVIIKLENGAVFNLMLSHLGSSRIGVQEYVELRAKNITIKINNDRDYFAENDFKILRTYKLSTQESCRRMYQAISKDILNKRDQKKSEKFKLWESMEQVKTLSTLILSLDEMVS